MKNNENIHMRVIQELMTMSSSRNVLLNSVAFVMPSVDKYISCSCLIFGAFIKARFDSMIILI